MCIMTKGHTFMRHERRCWSLAPLSLPTSFHLPHLTWTSRTSSLITAFNIMSYVNSKAIFWPHALQLQLKTIIAQKVILPIAFNGNDRIFPCEREITPNVFEHMSFPSNSTTESRRLSLFHDVQTLTNEEQSASSLVGLSERNDCFSTLLYYARAARFTTLVERFLRRASCLHRLQTMLLCSSKRLKSHLSVQTFCNLLWTALKKCRLYFRRLQSIYLSFTIYLNTTKRSIKIFLAQVVFPLMIHNTYTATGDL